MKRGGKYNTYKRDIRSRKRKICQLVPVGHSLRRAFPKAFEDSYNSTQFPLSSPIPIETSENLYNPTQKSPPKALTRQQKITEKRLNTFRQNKELKTKAWEENKGHRTERRNFHKKMKGIKRYKSRLRRRGFDKNMQERLINARERTQK